MRITHLPKEFVNARIVLESLENHGFEAYFVGGSVRDIMMQHPIHDVDIATSAYPSEVEEVFLRTIDLGIEHGTILVLVNHEQYEVTTFRTESGYQDYRRPDSVTFVRSLADDLKRRDFRMNALAMTKEGEIIDLFSGIDDIQNKVICAVGNPSERFSEDALRMMRALRFASQLDFTIEKQTFEAICRHHQLLKKISVERIQVEWLKLMAGCNPKKGIHYFLESQCYQSCPHLEHSKEALLYLYHHVNQPLTEMQTWLVLSCAMQFSRKECVRFLREWKCSKTVMNEVSHVLPYFYHRKERTLTDWEMYQLGEEGVSLIENTLFFFEQAPEDIHWQTRYEQLPIHHVKELAVDGKVLMAELNKKPGRWLGEYIAKLQKAVITKEVENKKDCLIALCQQWMEQENEGI